MSEGLLDDIERITELAARPGMSGMTPGEHQALGRVQAWLVDARAGVDEAPEPTSADGVEDELEPVSAREEERMIAEREAVEADEAQLAEGPEGDLIDLLGDTGEELMLAGFENLKQVCDATDEEILAVKGIGPVSLRQIREVAPKSGA